MINWTLTQYKLIMRLNFTSILFALSLILGIHPLTAQVVDPALQVCLQKVGPLYQLLTARN